ncbi:Pre-rRNA-processing protein RIX1 [Dissostichus eleginoides]|uniref:Pre-rRNA-processing protein RIX1 n=1 Tax=Dissostichus eleginoides TaxID=100907 RepID=A0AAD9B5R6_DISEL|nr:Pre-rRNA-processing protein RIX1 [Dissostichus eleginoides]
MSTLNALKATRTDETFSGIYDEIVQAVGEPVPQRKCRRRGWDDLEQGFNQHQEGDEETVVSFRRLYFQIVDGIVLHMTQRFADMEHLIFFRKLRNELHTLYNNRLFHKPPGELIELLIEDDLQGTAAQAHAHAHDTSHQHISRALLKKG